MDLKSVLKAKVAYESRCRQLEVLRYIQLDEFRLQFGRELIVRLENCKSLEDVISNLSRVDKAIAAMEKVLSGDDLSEETFENTLGCEKAEYEAALRDIDPVIGQVPEKLVLMTFDDATLDHYKEVGPIFEKYGAKANFCVCEMLERMGGGPGFDDKSVFMTWEQIKELADCGHEIMNHSWRHAMDFYTGSDEYLYEQIATIDQRCEENGIARPTAFAYPGGACSPRLEKILHEAGYHWARGDMKEVTPVREGQSYYDPYVDSPLAVPSFNGAPGFNADRIAEVLNYAKNGRVVVFAYHGATGPEFGELTLDDQVRCIYANGGRCITFTELEQYIDPAKAYTYTHL